MSCPIFDFFRRTRLWNSATNSWKLRGTRSWSACLSLCSTRRRNAVLSGIQSSRCSSCLLVPLPPTRDMSKLLARDSDAFHTCESCQIRVSHELSICARERVAASIDCRLDSRCVRNNLRCAVRRYNILMIPFRLAFSETQVDWLCAPGPLGMCSALLALGTLVCFSYSLNGCTVCHLRRPPTLLPRKTLAGSVEPGARIGSIRAPRQRVEGWIS
jgi:hypothetical protein